MERARAAPARRWRALGADVKGRLTFTLYVTSVPLAFFSAWAAALYVAVAAIWLVPDRRIERQMGG